MDFKSFSSRDVHNGVQYINFFGNGYGVSIVQHDHSWTNSDTWELAVLKGSEMSWDLCYTTPITNNVLEYLTPDEVNAICQKISELCL
jgi:hypothetical protein